MHKSHSKMSNRLVRSYTLVFAIILFVVAVVSYNYIIYTGVQIAMLNQKELANQAMIRIETYIADIDNKSSQVMADSRIINIFGRLQQDSSVENFFDSNVLAKIDIGSVLTSINGPSAPIWRISVYNQYGDFVSSGAMVDQNRVDHVLKTVNAGEEMVALLYMPEKLQIISPDKDRWSDTYTSNYLTIKRPLMNVYSKEVLGIVEVQQDISKLAQNLGFESLKDVKINVYDGSGNLILPQIANDKKTPYVSSVISKKYGWSVELAQTRKALLEPYRPIINMLGFGTGALFIIVIFIVFLVARRLSRPLVLLSQTIGSIDINTLPSTLPINDSIDEVNALKDAFALMIKRINISINHEKRAWLLSLQSQMNPHFLYNMLSVISAAGLEGGNEKIVDMCSRMSSMFRYVANYDETTVPARAELEHVQNYLELMKERYEHYFNFDIVADEAVKQMMIPKLVLQPLAENCFMHGFKDVEPPYYVRIEAFADDGIWNIRVIDNGSGMADLEKQVAIKKIEEYQNKLPENYTNMKIGGMGLVSSVLRFKLQNTNYIDYTIEDNLPNGTIISIRGEML